MSTAQVKLEEQVVTEPANEAANEAPNESSSGSANNPIKTVVDEILVFMQDIHDAKQELLARAVPFHVVNAMVALGSGGKLAQQADMKKAALEASQAQYGANGLTTEQLDEHVDALVALEKDLGHVRHLAKAQGMDINAINQLTMTIRQNPGDSGEKAINNLLAYALVCDIPLHRIAEIAESATAGPASVLPDISREELDVNGKRNKLIADICIGCLLAFIALSLLT